MGLHLIDHIIIGVYIIGLFLLGLKFSKKTLDSDEYLLSARRLTLPAFVMTLVTTWYGLILGVGEFVFGYGVVAWVTNGLFWYLVYLFFALFLSKRIHDSGHTTIADHLRAKIGNKSGTLGAIITYIMTTPAPYVFSLGLLINVLFGVSLFWSMSIGFLISALYIWHGGFKAVIRTDIFQFILMFGGFILLAFFSINTFGGFEFLKANLPATHLTFAGELPIQTIIVWGFLACWTLVDPNFYARCFAAKDGNTAKKGVLWSLLFWFIFDMLTLITGLYARAVFPESDALYSYLTLSNAILPIAVKGLFVVALLAIIMSTIDSFLFSSSTIIAKDFLQKKWSSVSLKTLTRVGIIITLIISMIFVVVFESVIGIIYAVGTVGVSALLIPMLLSFFCNEKLNDKMIMWSMLISGLSSGVWLVDGWLKQEYGWPVYWWNVEPMYIGIATSIVVIGGMWRWVRQK
jgi:SSS family solute:Na+ symporter